MKKYLLIFIAFIVITTEVLAQTVYSASSTTVYMTLSAPVKKPDVPPFLVIEDIGFLDQNGNKIIDAKEFCKIRFTVKNCGQGSAYKVMPTVKEVNKVKGLMLRNEKTIAELPSGASESVVVDIITTEELRTEKALFVLSAPEGNGFDAKNHELAVGTREYLAPKLVFADAKFSTAKGGTKVALGEVITMQVLVQNQGQGVAQHVKLAFIVPQNNVFPTSQSEYEIGTLAPGEKKVFDFQFVANNRYADNTLLVSSRLSEEKGVYGASRALLLELDRPISKIARMEIEGDYLQQEIVPASLHSDVDLDIPVNKGVQNNVFALIIGNENYATRTSVKSEVNVPFAQSDAVVFKEYVEKTLGVPMENITLLTNATKLQMENSIDRICKLAQTYNGEAEVIVYYAGHGLCDEEKNSYLIPVDVSGVQVKQGIKLGEVYRKLGELKKVKSTVFVDACFSGGARNGELLASRGLKIEPKEDVVKGNVVIFSATSGSESALPYKEQQHGMFTYYLLKKLKESTGNVSYGELSDYLRDEVLHNSIKVNDFQQTPVTQFSFEVEDSWSTWRLR